MIKTTQAALMALLLTGTAAPAFAQTMQPTTQPAQAQTSPLTPEQTAPAPDQTAPAAPADQSQSTDTMKPAHVKKVHHVHHRHKTKAVTQAKMNPGDTAKSDTAAANPGDTTTDNTAPK